MVMHKKILVSITLVILLLGGVTNISLGEEANSVEKVYKFEKDGRWGFFDLSGNVVIEPKFTYVEDFTEGVAVATLKETSGEEPWDYSKDYGYINPQGEWAIPPQFCGATSFTEGLAVVAIEDDYDLAYIDHTGKVVISFEGYIESARSFSEGLAAVSGPDPEDLNGYINQDGQWVVEPLYWPAEPFSEGLASVGLNGYYGYINQEGEMVIPPGFVEADHFDSGVAKVETESGESYYINTSGESVYGKIKM